MDARNILALDEALDSLDFVPQEVDSRKLASFNAQAPKKSRHEKEKEAAAKKAKEEGTPPVPGPLHRRRSAS